jgi:hypothetical protein
MGGHEARSHWEDRGLLMLMGGIVVPIAVWFIDLQVSYAMVKWVCQPNRAWLLLLVPLGSLSAVGIGGWLSWSCWTKLAEAQPAGGSMEDRSLLLALLGLGLNVITGLLILFSLAPRALLSPCE